MLCYARLTESLLPSVCPTTLTINPFLRFPSLKVLISELTTLTGVLLVGLLTPFTIPTFTTSTTITLSSAQCLHPSTLFSVLGPIDLNFSIQITVTFSW